MTDVGAGTGNAFTDQAFAAAASAYERTPERWEHAVQAAIAELFLFLAERPAQTTACIVSERGAESAALARLQRTIERFTGFLQPGFHIGVGSPPPVVAEAIGWGIFELVRCHALERRLDQLPTAVPDATIVALSPFIGERGAARLANSPNAVGPRPSCAAPPLQQHSRAQNPPMRPRRGAG